jgi:hypothetical protein
MEAASNMICFCLYYDSLLTVWFINHRMALWLWILDRNAHGIYSWLLAFIVTFTCMDWKSLVAADSFRIYMRNHYNRSRSTAADSYMMTFALIMKAAVGKWATLCTLMCTIIRDHTIFWDRTYLSSAANDAFIKAIFQCTVRYAYFSCGKILLVCRSKEWPFYLVTSFQVLQRKKNIILHACMKREKS